MQTPDHTAPAEPLEAPDERALVEALRRLRRGVEPRAVRCRRVVVSLRADSAGVVVHGA